MEEIIHTNCSEMSFAIEGSIGEIKEELNKMLDVVLEEGGVVRDGGENKGLKMDIDNARKEIEKAKDVFDLENITFGFTCNYETFFSAEDGSTLLVATCNNHEWEKGGVDVSHDLDVEYYDIVKEHYLFEKVRYKNWVVLHKMLDVLGIDVLGKIDKNIVLELPKGVKDEVLYDHSETFKEEGKRVNIVKKKSNEKVRYYLNDGLKLTPLKHITLNKAPAELKKFILVNSIATNGK